MSNLQNDLLLLRELDEDDQSDHTGDENDQSDHDGDADDQPDQRGDKDRPDQQERDEQATQQWSLVKVGAVAGFGLVVVCSSTLLPVTGPVMAKVLAVKGYILSKAVATKVGGWVFTKCSIFAASHPLATKVITLGTLGIGAIGCYKIGVCAIATYKAVTGLVIAASGTAYFIGQMYLKGAALDLMLATLGMAALSTLAPEAARSLATTGALIILGPVAVGTAIAAQHVVTVYVIPKTEAAMKWLGEYYDGAKKSAGAVFFGPTDVVLKTMFPSAHSFTAGPAQLAYLAQMPLSP